MNASSSPEAAPSEQCRLCGIRPPWSENTSVCGVCFGFEKERIDMDTGVTNYDPEAERRARPGACKDCGKTPDESPFYPSRKDRCKACIVRKTNERRAAADKNYTTLPEEAPIIDAPALIDPIVFSEIDAQPDRQNQTIVDEPTAPMVMCKSCGTRFEPWRNGGVTIKNKCRPCVINRRTEGWANNVGQESTVFRIDFRGTQTSSRRSAIWR